MDNWKNNEDAGDLTAMGAADASEFATCEDCEETYDLCECGTDPEDYEDNYSDAEADAATLASAGMGTDEDYGYGDGCEEW